jgi:hypothetical protein
MAMQNWTTRKTQRDASVRSQENKEIAATKYSAKVSKKAALVAAYRLGFSSISETYSDTYRERKDLSDKELEQFYAGFYAKSHGMESEF